MARVLIGTSGWHYDSWRGPFYPAGLPIKSQLQYYASQFQSAELNGEFYRTPTTEAVRSWKEQTGRDFVFTWKASKFITHWKRLSANSVNSLELMEDRLSLLGHKIGPVLFQLPPNFQADADRLSAFLRMLSPKRRYSFEFRHPSWYSPSIMRLLSKQNLVVHLRPSGRAGTVEADGGLHLYPGTWSRWTIPGALLEKCHDRVGQARQGVESAGLRRIRVLR